MVPVRKTLSRKACDLITPDAWVIDDTGFAKDGDGSPCVARQYSGTLGKVGNCQVAISVHAATDRASAPLDWRLYLPESWDNTGWDNTGVDDPETAAAIAARRRRSAIPDNERYRTKAAMALKMLDELISWGRVPPVIVADAGYGDSATFRQSLTDRDLVYVVAVKGATLAHPADAVPAAAAYSGRGRPPARRYPPAATCKDLVSGGRNRGADRGHLAPRNQDRPSQSDRGDALTVRGAASTSGEPHDSPRRGRCPAPGVAAGRMARRCSPAH